MIKKKTNEVAVSVGLGNSEHKKRWRGGGDKKRDKAKEQQ